MKIEGARDQNKRPRIKHRDCPAGTLSHVAAIITAPTNDYPESYLAINNNRERLKREGKI